MIIYNYDEQGYYTGLTRNEHPLQAIPPYWTKIEPPMLGDGEYARYVGRRWEVVTEKIYPKVVPPAISRRQAKQQLLLSGLLDDVTAGIEAIQDATERRMVQIYWDDSQEFERSHPMLTSLGGSILGLTDEQLDDLFIAASKL